MPKLELTDEEMKMTLAELAEQVREHRRRLIRSELVELYVTELINEIFV